MRTFLFLSALNPHHGNENAINRLKRTAVHYYQRKSASDYLDFNSNKRSLEGTGGYVKFGRKGNAKWIFSETYSWSSPGFDMNDIGYLKQTDFRSNTTEIGFRKTNIWKQFRSNTLTLSQQNKWDYGGNAFSNDIALEWVTMTLNRLELDVKQAYNWNWVDSRMLRGGPDVRFDPYFQTTAKFNTDKAKRMPKEHSRFSPALTCSRKDNGHPKYKQNALFHNYSSAG